MSFRVGKRLDRAAVSRAHDVLYRSDAWTDATWLGAQALKNPLDLWVYQEIMAETRPELVVETGTYRGGSAFFLASICDLLGAGEVLSLDIEPVRDDYPKHARITYFGGRSSTDPGCQRIPAAVFRTIFPTRSGWWSASHIATQPPSDSPSTWARS